MRWRHSKLARRSALALGPLVLAPGLARLARDLDPRSAGAACATGAATASPTPDLETLGGRLRCDE